MYLKMTGAFDYEFTTADIDNTNFVVCYSDWVRSSDYKGQTFNSIRYNGTKFSTDKIELKSKASCLKVFPAKAGSIMIMEYFKKISVLISGWKNLVKIDVAKTTGRHHEKR